MREHVLPAYTHLAAALTELLGSGKNDMGLCYFADGKDYYRYLVCHNTGSASDLPALQDRILENGKATCSRRQHSSPKTRS